ncbi:MAG: ADP-forming succinate--CoA ligase subunit beta [Cystobacterineae bacterium]|nr:ADP-forming succinate--CoA ligase subunit beta [Cystobacterineae bacterium]
MKIHEYQAKELLKAFGVPTPRGGLAHSPEEAKQCASQLGTSKVVLKAQIHAGGRGKAGGVQLAKTPTEAAAIAETLLGRPLVTAQTGPKGSWVRKLWVEEGLDIEREFYVGLVLDRACGRLCFMASAEGGMEIEEIAATSPEKILRRHVDMAAGFQPYIGRSLAFQLGLSGGAAQSFGKLCHALLRAYVEYDASTLEINPLVLLKSGELMALDCKMELDDNALFRQPKLLALEDEHESEPRELSAKAAGLAYISLHGDIGCMVNGAGLAMATMDAIGLAGGKPANFLDVGGGADQGKVSTAFKLILEDTQVRAVLVNIFGGIMRCDVIAEGIIAAAKEVGLKLPLVVRLQGTNVEKGKALLEASGLSILPADSLPSAAQAAVLAAQKGGSHGILA